MRAVEGEDQARERRRLGFGIVGLVEGWERGDLGEVKSVVLGSLVRAS